MGWRYSLKVIQTAHPMTATKAASLCKLCSTQGAFFDDFRPFLAIFRPFWAILVFFGLKRYVFFIKSENYPMYTSLQKKILAVFERADVRGQKNGPKIFFCCSTKILEGVVTTTPPTSCDSDISVRVFDKILMYTLTTFFCTSLHSVVPKLALSPVHWGF